MHPVLKNLLARKNQTVLIPDNRKIVLVLYGGTMTSIRTVAVLNALSEFGLIYAFDEIYAVSAGFPAASFFLSGQAKELAQICLQDLSGKKFLNYLRFWRMFDSQYLLDIFGTKGKLDTARLYSNKTKLYTGLYNLNRRKAEYLEIHDLPNDYFRLLEASVAAYFFRPGSVEINGMRYKDLPYRNHYHQNHFAQATKNEVTDVLVVFNYLRQRGKVFPGSTPENVFDISPRSQWHLSRFDTRPEKLKEQYQLMKDYAKQILSDIIRSDD